MRILFVSNHTTEKCGVAEFGRQNVAALEALGHDVVVWTPTPDDHEWPHSVALYDVIHVNYHPGTINYLRPLEALRRPKLSAFFHEPGTLHQFGDPEVSFQAEYPLPDLPGNHQLLFMPVPDYTPPPQLWHAPNMGQEKYMVGWSSIRQDGADHVRAHLLQYFSEEQARLDCWRKTDREIERLAECDYLVYWYGGANRGQSAGVTMGIAAQRPIVLNHNRMFESLEEYEDELYFCADLEEGLAEVTHDLHHGIAKIPRRAKQERSWTKAAITMASAWV